ncbi:cobalt-precorrin-6A reductase [Burkholderia thailandensis]|uniref:cobalt-precorrin-6A reductase n=2 Tax=Burkholderia thailandensis TaxID=57975 RepID=UPI0003ECB024|nr:cobalt-precorrin-6A reductase [Burkholderia thailandensis]AHI63028.1 precorrin-6x reductase CbiJ/CobK family protein [Burkholderia thailandensis H0587]AOJ50957.1 cobalt-precorrin-6A reductase [Burkholderia thailandensis]AVR26386.1 cobalt-precorrin-6A reductase [Burkholderia thailandensis]MCZ2893745.1 cobalt-precorrin-6A reductase [Burkholderia thailandensis]MCZ2899537.1 cobalt-precorrin-6A reductase [Burkholderia thailandensis]
MSARRVLLLGGTGDALRVARTLAPHDVYSLAGLGKAPDDLACDVRIGGFGGAEGLARHLREHAVALVVDATHPFAARISANAAAACRAAGVPYWALRRAPWRPRPGDDWRCVADWAGVLAAIAPFARPLFTLGREPLAHLDEIPLHQHWLVRCLDAHEGNARARVLAARGPFSIDGERTLFATAAIDVVVSKNSGGAATEAKLEVARERRIPVVMVGRPALPDADREFGDTAALVDALRIFRAVGAHGAHRAFRAS